MERTTAVCPRTHPSFAKASIAKSIRAQAPASTPAGYKCFGPKRAATNRRMAADSPMTTPSAVRSVGTFLNGLSSAKAVLRASTAVNSCAAWHSRARRSAPRHEAERSPPKISSCTPSVRAETMGRPPTMASRASSSWLRPRAFIAERTSSAPSSAPARPAARASPCMWRASQFESQFEIFSRSACTTSGWSTSVCLSNHGATGLSVCTLMTATSAGVPTSTVRCMRDAYAGAQRRR
mmetsp:Transcript_12207/g.30728  ORF Transcript_12207/g.30728 Transcript_12207/m.30728 type:complete len:237 (+) Transcript_12207:370-1080(+)